MKIGEIINLVLNDLRGKLSNEQKETITRWLKKDKNNITLYNQTKDLFFASKEIPLYEKIDDAAAWKNINDIIKHKRKRRFLNIFKYAAAILILLGISITLTYYFPGKFKQNEIADFSQIAKPGVKKAFIKLSNNKIIELNDGTEQSITEDSVLLSKNSQNRLSYKVVPLNEKFLENIKNKNHTVFVPRGGEYSIELNDGTKVWLNSMTEMIYPVAFTGDHRTVYLKGEAYFEVAKDSLHPFIVNTSKNNIEVLGTSFNYRAYPDEDNTEVTLVEGSIRLSNKKASQIISPGEQAIAGEEIDPIEVREVNIQLYTSWKDGRFSFHRMPMERIAENLGRWYDVDFIFLDEKSKSMRFTGAALKDKPIGFILKMIEETTNIEFTIQKEKAIAIKQK